MAYRLMHGNPHDSARLEKEKETYKLLDSLEIEYDRVDHEAAFTIEQCLEIESVLGTEICKNLFLRNSNSSKYYLLLMPGAKQFKTKVLSAEIGSTRLSFAGEEEMLKFLNITPGAVSVMGLMNDTENEVELLIDREILQMEFIGCHPCINTSSIKLKMSDLTEKVLPHIHHTFREVTL